MICLISTNESMVNDYIIRKRIDDYEEVFNAYTIHGKYLDILLAAIIATCRMGRGYCVG